MSPCIDFFLFVGSTYTYLSVHRAGNVANAAGVDLNWRPFSVRSIMIEQNNRPFVGKPEKCRYMWRDIERRAHRHGIAFESTPRYPIDADELANRVATVAAQEDWCPAFCQAAFAAWFLGNRDPGDRESLVDILKSLGRNADHILARADSSEIRDAYAAETDRARSLGIFGSPTFACGEEIFWGDDRLEDAIDWCKSGPS